MQAMMDFPEKVKMMLNLPFVAVLSTFVLLLILIKYWKVVYKPSSTQKVPPGPPKLPLIGNLHQLIGPLPHRTLANLAKKHGPIMRLQLGEQVVVVISSSEIAKEVLSTKEICFAQRPLVVAMEIMSYDPPGLFCAAYGDYWRQIRKICVLDLLSAKRVMSFRSIREEEAWELVETICKNEGCVMNLSPMLCLLASNVTSRAAFGLKCKEQEEFLSLLDEAIDVLAGFNLVDLYPSLTFLHYITGFQPTLEKLHRKISKILDGIIEKHNDDRRRRLFGMGRCNQLEEEEEEKKYSAPQNIIDMLIELQESNHLRNDGDLLLTNNHLKGVVMDIFSAGTETSSTTMEWAMAELARNPEEMEKAQAQVREALEGKVRIEERDIEKLNCLKLIVKETLRLHPPGALLPREARERCDIDGYEIPVKTKIIINEWALGRDERNWSEPDAFKPERFLNSGIDFKGTDYEFLPFGAGRRMCPGISFATTKIELALAQILYHFDWKLPHGIEPQELDMSEAFGLSVRKKHNLELIPTIRIPFKKTDIDKTRNV